MSTETEETKSESLVEKIEDEGKELLNEVETFGEGLLSRVKSIFHHEDAPVADAEVDPSTVEESKEVVNESAATTSL